MQAPPPVTISPGERTQLLHWSRGRSVSVRQSERARIVLLAAEGRNNKEIGRVLHISPVTVRRWRSRFALLGMAGISADAPRSGHKERPRSPTVALIRELTLSRRPTNGLRWTTRSLGKELGVSHTTIRRAWRNSGIEPPRYRHWRLHSDPRFLERDIDVAGIYVNPPGTVLALSVVPRSVLSRSGGFAPAPIDPAEAASSTPGGGERLAEAIGALDRVPRSAASWRLTSRELLLFLQAVNERSAPMAQIHLLTGAAEVSRDDRVLRWIDRHPRFHLVTLPSDRPISSVVRDWFEPHRATRPDTAGLPTLPTLVRLLETHMQGVTLFGRPFAWTPDGLVSHWGSAPGDTFSSSNSVPPRFSLRTLLRSE